MTDPHTDNEKTFTFDDIIEDPGLAYRISPGQLAELLATYVDKRRASMPDPAKLNLSRPVHQKLFTSESSAVSRLKVKLDEAGEKIVHHWKKEAAEIDTRRKMIRDALERLRDDLKAPVTDWKRREAAKAQAEKEAREQAEAEKSLRMAQDGQEGGAATLPADDPETPAGGQKIGVSGDVSHAIPPQPKLTLARTATRFLFIDKETGANVFETAAGGIGEWGARHLFNQAINVWGAIIENTHGKRLISFDISDIHGAL